MRYNNGVHQYATDPKWHTKIANIMKRSERYTKPASPSKTKTKTVLETVEDSKEVEKETNLIGFKYDDGRFFVDEKGRVCDREANAIWSKPNTKGRYLTRTYKSEATSQKTLFDECLNQLKKHNSPEVSYDVKPDKIPKDLDIGDRVRIIDHDYGPALYLDARLVEITTSSKSDYINNAVFANFIPRDSGIAESLLSLQSDIRDFKYSFDNLPYVMEIESSSGNVFKDDIVDTNLIAKLTKAGIDQSANVDGFIWERISKYPDKLVVSDDDWNNEHEDDNEHFIELTRSDIELEASFACTAMLDGVGVASASYNIKNLSIGIYKQKDEPDRDSLMWGDVWQWDDGDTHFKRIWKGDKWEDTVTKRDLELLELTPGPPGADGKDGMPGKPGADGKTSYMHFAYADSQDGVVGFTLTATSGKKYIGFYTDFVKEDSKDPKKYEWSKYVGDDGKPGKDGVNGLPGKAGQDGKTPYFHTAWANSSDGSKDFSISQAGEKLYIGTYTDFTKEDSTDPKKYTWQLVKGNTGPKGAKGVDGKDGHVLTVEVWLEGEFRNYKTKDVKRIIQAKYDGEDIELNDTNTEVYNCYGNGEWSRATLSDFWADWDRKYEYIANKVVVSYKGLKAEAYARLDNIKDGEKGEPGKQGVPGKDGIDGKDGKTGKIGQNLLRNSNVAVSNKLYNTKEWTLCETPITGETMTFTAKVKLEKDDKLMLYNSSGMIHLNWWTEVKSGDYVIYSSTFNWRDKIEYNGKTYEQTNPPTLKLYTQSNGNGDNINNNTVSIEWATLTRGDIPAIEWSPCYADLDDAISEKASEESLQDLQVHFAVYPTAEELRQSQVDILKQKSYLDQLKNAVESNALNLEDRIAIIEQNVGAGKLTLDAITTYLNFGEEGVLIGKESEQVRLRLINNALEITDGSKVVARFANNQTETPNLKVSGTFEFGYHVAGKMDKGRDKFTIISPNI